MSDTYFLDAKTGRPLQRRRVIFLCKARLRSSGSRFMRCDQLAGFLSEYEARAFEPELMFLNRPEEAPQKWKKILSRSKDAFVIALKGSLDVLSEAEREELRAAAHCLAIDHVDNFQGGDVFRTADLHIAASEASLQFMERKCSRIARRDGFDMPRFALVDHHADPRVMPAPQPTSDGFCLGYLGDPRNTHIPKGLTLRVEQGQDQDSFQEALTRIPEFHMHYCVRVETSRKQQKPFTKGFIAAQANRNILTTPDVPDATRFLGEDYPYLAADNSDEAILEAAARANRMLGTVEWTTALRRIAQIRQQVSPPQIAAQLADVIQRVF